jgi:hypothetical protein
MTTKLTEEEMRRVLFSSAQAPAAQMPITDPMVHIPNVMIVPRRRINALSITVKVR